MGIEEFINSRTVVLSPFRGIVVVTVNMDEYRAVAAQFGLPLHTLHPSYEAFVQSQTNRQDGNIRCIMMVNPLNGDITSEENMIRFNGILVHEIQHLVARLQRTYGYDSVNEDEPVAYLIQYLYQTIAAMVYNAVNVHIGGYDHTTARMADELYWMPDKYTCAGSSIPSSVVSSAMINYHHAIHNNQLYMTPGGYTATTYWW